MPFTTEQLARLSPDDREEVLEFAEFLQQAGGGPKGMDRARLKELIESDPDRWLPYLGITREWAREHGCDV